MNTLQIDLAEILEGLDLPEDIAKFAKRIIAMHDAALTELSGSLSITLGIVLEYAKATKQILLYIKGTTGLELSLPMNAIANFIATIGHFSANVDVIFIVDNYGDRLSIRFGLEDSLNYYLPPANQTSAHEGFVVLNGTPQLVDDVSITGRVSGSLEAEFIGVPGDANAFVKVSISNINNLIQRKPGAVAQSQFNLKIPSFVDAVDSVFEQAEDLSLVRSGIITRLDAPFIGRSAGRSLKAGKSDNDIVAECALVFVVSVTYPCMNYVDYHRDPR